MTPEEVQILAGTRLLTARELAPRIGLGSGRKGVAKVLARANAGTLPCWRPNDRTRLFHWPTIARLAGAVRT